MPTLSLNASKKTKQTPAGEIPVDWGCVKLGEVSKVITGSTPPDGTDNAYGGEVPFITPGDLNRHAWVNKTERTLTETGLKASRVIPKDSTVVVCIGSSIGKCAITNHKSGANQQINAAIPGPDVIPFFLLNAAKRGMAKMARWAGNQAVPIINKSEFSKLPIPLPPLPEQRKIADILATWDRALETLDRLIAAKTRRKQALMQQLLTGKKRLPGFSGEWDYASLSEVFERITDKADKQTERVLSLTAGTGFVDQRKKWSREVAGKNIENYILLKRGEFSYNKGNSKRYPQGCIYRLEEFDDGAVPNVWYSFRLSRKDCHPIFYKQYFLAGGLNHQLSRIINSGVRNDGLLNLTANNFFSAKVPIPSKEEQSKLGTLFDTADHELRLLKQQRTALEQQKRGLMQQLLTGKTRVNT